MFRFSWSPKKAMLLAAALTFALYTPALFNGFVSYDDSLLIYRNPNVLTFSPVTVKAIFMSYDPELYVPITLLTYQIEHLLFGLNPLFFHLTSVLLHVLNTVLVFAILKRLSLMIRSENESLWIATVGTLIFALHPINTEAVAWLAARKDLLSSTFCLGSLLCYLQYRDEEKRSRLIWSIALFTIGMGAKVSIIMLPAALLLIDSFTGRRIDRDALMEKIPYGIAGLIFGIIAVIGKIHQLSPLTLIEQVMLGMRGAVFYLMHFFVPRELSLLHPQEWPIDLLTSEMIIPLVLGLLLIMVAIVFSRSQRLITVGIGFYLLMILPTFATFWKNGFVYFASERYPYVALLSVIFLLCAWLVPLGMHRLKPVISGLIMITLVSMLGFLTTKQIGTWKDSETLLRHTLKFNPESAHAMNNLGTALYEQGRVEEAMALYDQALITEPDLPSVHANRGLVLLKQGKKQEAEEAFRAGINVALNRQIIENDLTPDFLLAEFLFNEGRSSEGLAVLEKAVLRGPDFFAPHHNVAIKYQQLGRALDAQEHLSVALEKKPRHLDALYRYAAVSAELGQLEEASAALQKILRIDPHYEQAAAHLNSIEQMIRR